MASKGFKLNDNQKWAAGLLYRTGRMETFDGKTINDNTIKSLVNKGVIEQKPKADNWTFYSESFQFTPDGQAWADAEFGSNAPDPDEPMTARDAMLATEPVLARDWLSDEDNEAFAELNIEPLPVVAENATAETAAPEIGMQWLRREDLPPVETVYFCQRMGYVHPTMRQNAPISSRRQAKQARVVCLPNMQRRTANKPVKVEKREPLHETVLQIVSRIQTPLTSQVRRIA